MAAHRRRKRNHPSRYVFCDEWYTPPKYIEAVREVLGTIDLDPASHERPQSWIKAARYFTKEDDGLRHLWRGTVFLNPPYNRFLLAPFVVKLLRDLDAGRITAAILLVHNSTAAWYQDAMRACDLLCTPLGRIAFERPGGGHARSHYQQTFSYFGPHRKRFARVFGNFGVVVQPVANGEHATD
jgi:phage N-6-adenine-methyltransferase